MNNKTAVFHSKNCGGSGFFVSQKIILQSSRDIKARQDRLEVEQENYRK